jgi:hypothetical protein
LKTGFSLIFFQFKDFFLKIFNLVHLSPSDLLRILEQVQDFAVGDLGLLIFPGYLFGIFNFVIQSIDFEP